MAIRVLVVDDSVVIRRLVVQALESDPGIEVAGTAANGQLAQSKFEQLRPDVITMDVEMPIMNGVEAVRALRAKGHAVTVEEAMGSTQSVMMDPESGFLLGASDPRRPDAATVGY